PSEPGQVACECFRKRDNPTGATHVTVLQNTDGVRGTPFAVAGSNHVRENISSDIPYHMPEHSLTAEVRPNESAGHLSVHVDGVSTVETPFLFEQQQKRAAPAAVASAAAHGVFGIFIVLMIRFAPTPVYQAAVLPEQPNEHIIWLSEPGPGGGGG